MDKFNTAKPTLKFLLLFFVVVLFFIGWILLHDQIFLKVSISLLIIISFSYFIIQEKLSGLSVNIGINKLKADVGSIIDQSIEIKNNSKFTKHWLEFTHSGGLIPESSAKVIESIKPNNTYVNYSKIIACKRGIFDLGDLLIKSGDPFGFFKIENHFGKSRKLVIFPKIFDLKNDLRYAIQNFGSKSTQLKSRSITTIAGGVGEYVTGDSLNRVHWPISAKRDKLTVKEFDQESLSLIWVVVDAKKGTHFHEDKESPPFLDLRLNPKRLKSIHVLPRDSFEYGLSLAASISAFYIKKKFSVGLVSEGNSFIEIQPESGARQLDKILVNLSKLNDTGQNSSWDVLNQQSTNFRSGCVIFIITPKIDVNPKIINEYRIRKKIYVIPILINKESFELNPRLSSDDHQQERIEGIVVNYKDNLSACLNQPFNLEHKL